MKGLWVFFMLSNLSGGAEAVPLRALCVIEAVA